MVSEADPNNLASSSEELVAQKENMIEATNKLLAVVSEVGRGLVQGCIKYFLSCILSFLKSNCLTECVH